MLIFLLGVWLWDNHLGKPALPPGQSAKADTWELAFRKADRDLRLAEGTAHMPSWVQPLLGIDNLQQTLATRINALAPLVYGRHRHDETDPRSTAMADEGAFALGVMIAVHGQGNAANGPFQQLGIPGAPSTEEIMSRIIEGREHWWDLAYLQALELPASEAEAGAFAAQLVDARTRHLVSNTIKARGAVIAVTLGGLIFLPGTLLGFMRSDRPRGYVGRWTLSFGLGVFLLAYLAYLGFSLSFSHSIDWISRIPSDEGGPLMTMPVFITLDSLTRFLPALIALGLLFRRCRHAISRLGLAGPLDGRMVLGGFAILQIIEFGLRMTIDRSGTPDATGGLSMMEVGPWGLVLGVASACLAAPVAEEILYRGVLFRSLHNRMRLAPAVLISSVVFALVHFYTLPSLIMVGCVGAVCALGYSASRSLLTAIVLHALYNASIKIPEWIVYQTALS
ncbi:CPBP family intramembrane glutamic endopeptidase [Haloferula rosea]|uniref:CPBP family intramembrane metalloprotease n=1 Tax=Haloferula rosea TaxID=490093 RepID=A0A934RA63_9BACT|nr:CPBP family intramembrane glutamic endopeptidase [Haloferula rosea]MBK1826853.1 CPBP family intramembrane metalloprotease [Haloferula rosea]